MNLMARMVIGLIFLLSALLKLSDPAVFQGDLQVFPFVPYSAAFAIALFVPWFEILAAVSLLLRRLQAGALLLLAVMTAGFIGFIGLAVLWGVDADCGCFGEWFVFPNPATHIAFNLVLLGLIVWQLRAESNTR